MTNEEFEQFSNFINTTLYETMTLDDYETVMESLDIPRKRNTNEYKSACHNDNLSQAKYNLMFYPNTRSYYCFSECRCSFNILTLVEKIFITRGVLNISDKQKRVKCMKYICEQCNIPFDFETTETKPKLEYNWKKALLKYLPKDNTIEELTIYDKKVLELFPKLYHSSWIDYGISIETMEKYDIRFYHFRQQIIVPCFDKNNQLCGIRVRNTIDDIVPKYTVLQILNGNQYSFPTGQLFYGEYQNSDEIMRTKSAILVEAEKTVLKFDTWFGKKNISLGLFGSSLTKAKLLRLLELEVTTVYIMIDSDFTTIDSDEFKKFEEKVYKMYDMMKPYIPNIYVVYNNQGWENCYKFSPTDYSREQFNILMKEKERIE